METSLLYLFQIKKKNNSFSGAWNYSRWIVNLAAQVKWFFLKFFLNDWFLPNVVFIVFSKIFWSFFENQLSNECKYVAKATLFLVMFILL